MAWGFSGQPSSSVAALLILFFQVPESRNADALSLNLVQVQGYNPALAGFAVLTFAVGISVHYSHNFEPTVCSKARLVGRMSLTG